MKLIYLLIGCIYAFIALIHDIITGNQIDGTLKTLFSTLVNIFLWPFGIYGIICLLRGR